MSQSSSSGQGHQRTRSKAARPRSSTKGPLDASELPIRTSTPPARAGSPGSAVFSSPRHQSVPAPLQPHPLHQASGPPPGPSPRYPPTPARPGFGHGPHAGLPKDFSYLLRPEIYHPLTTLNTAQPFRSSSRQPDPSTPIPELVAKGHFRAAAIAAVQELTATAAAGSDGAAEAAPRAAIDPSDAGRIFSLLYTRLACLTLIEATSLAAQEVKALEDLNNAARYVDETTGEHLVPWELRVLNVRLQALGFGDPRRAVMSYYDLSREAREQIARAGRGRGGGGGGEQEDAAAATAIRTWKLRLHDLGIRVAGALVEMNDLVGAADQLGSLRDPGDGKLALSRALAWLQIGDTDAAAACVAGIQGGEEGESGEGAGGGEGGRGGEGDGGRQQSSSLLVKALCDMAGGAYGPALEKWQALREMVDDEMVGVNTAVCLLYLGRMNEGRDLLQGLAEAGYRSHTLLFNLCTIYELCTERNRDLKMALAEKVAEMEEGPAGWEKTTTDFKM